MGEEASERRRPTHERPSIAGVVPHDLFGVIGPFFKLKHEEAFDELADYLVSLSCRDQEEEPVAGELPADVTRRAEGHRLASVIQDQARRMALSLDAIHDAFGRFEATVDHHPPLLEAIFEVDTGDPRNLFYPNEIAILLTFFRELDWDRAADALTRLAAIPVREKLARGPLRNETLRRAVAACRAYWRDVEGLPWSMSSLKVKNVRDLNDPRNLQGRCEAFVSDMINQCGIVHGLHDLCSAWTAVDQS